jgi:hypothetical protein
VKCLDPKSTLLARTVVVLLNLYSYGSNLEMKVWSCRILFQVVVHIPEQPSQIYIGLPDKEKGNLRPWFSQNRINVVTRPKSFKLAMPTVGTAQIRPGVGPKSRSLSIEQRRGCVRLARTRYRMIHFGLLNVGCA